MKVLDKRKKSKRRHTESGRGGFGGGGYGRGGGSKSGRVNYNKPYVFDPATYITLPPPEVTTPPEKFVDVDLLGPLPAAETIDSKPVVPQPKSEAGGVSGKPVYEVIQNPNPISALHEYCKKGQ